MSRTYNTDPFRVQMFKKAKYKCPKNWKDYDHYWLWKDLQLSGDYFNCFYGNNWHKLVSNKERGKTEFRRMENRSYRAKNRQRLRNGDYETLRWRRNVDWNWY